MTQQIAEEVLREKYAKGGETTLEEVRRRLARALSVVEKDQAAWEERFFEVMEAGFIPGGRINSAAGTGIGATLINCFVQPVGDAMSESDPDSGKPGITAALGEAAETMRRGGGVGYDFSRLRPAGARVKGTDSLASGPLSYMRMFDAMCRTVESAGSRRGAQMGVLRCDHPDIEAFIGAKAKPYGHKDLTQFNLSVAVTDAFMRSVEDDGEIELVHRGEPGEALRAAGAYRRDDGLWVYRRVRARALWDQIMRSTYDFADPGVLFIDRVNQENNLWYCERIETTNPCGEQPLPDYGCCDLGSIDLTRFVEQPFTSEAAFGYERFEAVVGTAIRMLDNVLDVTLWPLEKQRAEAMAKRRVGLGFTGLGDALIMLGLKYDTAQAREQATRIARVMRDAAYRASVELAKEKGAFPRFDAEKYLESGFMRRMPGDIREEIRKHGTRNSHLLSIAPTGTISLVFGDNCSSGIEPVFSWFYQRKVRQGDGSTRSYRVYDSAYLAYKTLRGWSDRADEQVVAELPLWWVAALTIPASDHAAMSAAVAPYIDTAISKTVNVAEDYPYEDFQEIYRTAWRHGLKGITTYRPNSQVDSVLSTVGTESQQAPDFDQSDPDRRIRLEHLPEPALASLRWRKRPRLPGGNPSWTYMVSHPHGYHFAVFVGHIENTGNYPFEVWVNGAEAPRGLGALAKSLSMDMRCNDRHWLKTKLDSLARAGGDDAFDLAVPPDGRQVRVPSIVAGFATLVRYRCQELGAFEGDTPSPVLDALMSPKEPKTGPDGTLSWTVDIYNPNTGDDFVLGLKEAVLPDGSRRPYSVWLSGEYPRTLDGLCKSLSYDMRVVDPAWCGAKLRQLLDFQEHQGEFFAREPGSRKSVHWPSTVAYMARLIIHRYARLGILDEEGFPMDEMGVMTMEADNVVPLRSARAAEVMPGKRCPECGNYAVIKKDGCDFCTACGAQGACG